MRVKKAAEILLEYLDGVPRVKAELLEMSGIPNYLWLPAIRTLLNTGSAIKTGSRRGTRYLAGSYVYEDISVFETSTVAESHFGLVEKVLRDIDPMTDFGERGEEPKAADAGMKPALHDVHDDQDEDDNTDEVVDTLSMLRANGLSKIIDHRPRGGCLWVIEEPGVEPIVALVSKTTGARFHYKAEGAKSTGWDSAWWTVDE